METLALALIFLAAGVVKGTIGMGLPTLGMGLLTLLLPPAEAAALLLLPNILTNLVQMHPLAETARLARRLWPMLAGVLAGIALAAWFAGGFGGRAATLLLGLALALYGALGLIARRPPMPERIGFPIGLATGALTATTGVFAIPSVPWLQARGLAKEELVRALALSFTLSSLALGVLLRGSGALDLRALGASALALIPALIGQWLGSRLRGRLSEPLFKRAFSAGLILLGAVIALRA